MIPERVGKIDVGQVVDVTDVLEKDPCFGRSYSASAEECGECLLPLVVNDRIRTCRTECKARTYAARPVNELAWNPSYRDVAARLIEGYTTDEIVEEMAGTDDPEVVKTARQTLSARLSYIRHKKGWAVPGL